MGNRHSASGITANRRDLGTKAQRAAIGKARAPKVVVKPAHAGLGKAHRPLPTENRGSQMSPIGDKPRQVKRQKDGGAVHCTFCGMRGHARRPIAAFQQPTGEMVPACNICSRLRKQPERPALPAPRLNAYIRPIRRELRKMIGNVPRQIPTGPVIVLGPGPNPTGYDPVAIEKTREAIKTELEKLTALRENKRPGKAAWRGACNASWEIRNQEQRVQNLRVHLHFLELAA